MMVRLHPATIPGRAIRRSELLCQTATDQHFEALINRGERDSGNFGTYAQEHVLRGGVDSAAGDVLEDGGALIGITVAVLLKSLAQHQIVEFRI